MNARSPLMEYPVISRALNGDQKAIDYLRYYDPERPLLTIKDMERMSLENLKRHEDEMDRMRWELYGKDLGEPEPTPGAHVEKWQKAQAYNEATMEQFNRRHLECGGPDGKRYRWGQEPKSFGWSQRPLSPRSAYIFDFHAMTDQELQEWIDDHKDWEEE